MQFHLSKNLHIGCHLVSIEQFRPFRAIGLSNVQTSNLVSLIACDLLSLVYVLELACATESITSFHYLTSCSNHYNA